jgi:NADH:ubiquinone oxidoreductase subunit 6 (subunit J)
VGPPLLQPFADFVKLLGKEVIDPKGVDRKAFDAAPLLALAAVFVGLVLLFGFLNLSLDPLFQSLLYIGPVAVFFAFVILYLGEPRQRSRYRFRAFGVLGAALVFSGFIGVLSYLGSVPSYAGAAEFNMADLADSLLNQYGLLILVLGLLLSAAAFGAVALAKKEEEEQ